MKRSNPPMHEKSRNQVYYNKFYNIIDFFTAPLLSAHARKRSNSQNDLKKDHFDNLIFFKDHF